MLISVKMVGRRDLNPRPNDYELRAGNGPPAASTSVAVDQLRIRFPDLPSALVHSIPIAPGTVVLECNKGSVFPLVLSSSGSVEKSIPKKGPFLSTVRPPLLADRAKISGGR